LELQTAQQFGVQISCWRLEQSRPQRAITAGNGQLIVKHFARLSMILCKFRDQQLDPFAIRLEPSAGERGEALDVAD
jgi:hypothetical protein